MADRPYQSQALDNSFTEMLNGIFRQLIVHPTGTGKTYVFSRLRKHHKFTKRGMVLVHRDELAQQAADKIRRWNPGLNVEIEMGDSYASNRADTIIASVQTLGRKGNKRIQRFNPIDFDHFITDEAHHSPADSYISIYEYFGLLREDNEVLNLGVTATPNRPDGQGLGKVYDKIVHQYPMRDAIKDGWLSDLKGLKVSTAVVLDDVKTRAGDFAVDELSRRVNQRQRNQVIIDAWMENARKMQTIAFCVDIAHSQELAKEFQRYGIKAEAVWGVDPYRAEKLRMHREGKLQLLCNCEVLTEGYDDWRIECGIMARPTKSQLKYIQMAGRLTRIPDFPEGMSLLEARRLGLEILKDSALLLDVVDNTTKHSLTTLPSLFGLNAKADIHGKSVLAVAEKIEELQKTRPDIDLSKVEDLEKVEKYIEQVDLWKIKWAPEVVSNSLLQWRKKTDGSLVLTLPKSEAVVIRKDLLDKYEVSASINGNRIDQADLETLPKAFEFAEKMVSLFGKEFLPLLRREGTGAKWHAQAPTEKQLARLRKWYGDKPEFSSPSNALKAGITKGKAGEMITKKIFDFRARQEAMDAA